MSFFGQILYCLDGTQNEEVCCYRHVLIMSHRFSRSSTITVTTRWLAACIGGKIPPSPTPGESLLRKTKPPLLSSLVFPLQCRDTSIMLSFSRVSGSQLHLLHVMLDSLDFGGCTEDALRRWDWVLNACHGPQSPQNTAATHKHNVPQPFRTIIIAGALRKRWRQLLSASPLPFIDPFPEYRLLRGFKKAVGVKSGVSSSDKTQRTERAGKGEGGALLLYIISDSKTAAAAVALGDKAIWYTSAVLYVMLHVSCWAGATSALLIAVVTICCGLRVVPALSLRLLSS